ncbi:MAG: alcohol dehydrogenase [Candidatus Tectimicrobiota bacterium]|nr:MAG: alcohol dehydrogenase [Candidatus Tectomicrobia bacterium]
MKLQGKVALITGAGSGFGRASAQLFAQEGARVVLVDVNESAARQTQATLEGSESAVVAADVTRAADTARMVQAAVERYGRLDILFNNAGISVPPRPAEDVDEETWDRIMAVNLKGVFLGCKYAIPVMKRQGGGVILNTASVAGLRPRLGTLPYATSKGAVITLTKALALELAPHRIRVNCLAPVAADTPLLRTIVGDDPQALQSRMASIPWGRLATVEDVARAALYLVSDDADMLTGVCLPVDGGRSL